MLMIVLGNGLRCVPILEQRMQSGPLERVLMQQSSQQVLGGLGELSHSIGLDADRFKGKGLVLELGSDVLIGESVSTHEHMEEDGSQVPHHHCIVLFILVLLPRDELRRLMLGTPQVLAAEALCPAVILTVD